MNEPVEPYASKALEALAGAQSELSAARHNNAANRAYYAAYHAAIAVLMRAGHTSRDNVWGHDEVKARFARELIQSRKLFPSDFASVLYDLMEARLRADYGLRPVSRSLAESRTRLAERFVRRLLE